jgi:hypothetical protein
MKLEAERLHHRYCGPEHLLLGLLGQADTTAARPAARPRPRPRQRPG